MYDKKDTRMRFIAFPLSRHTVKQYLGLIDWPKQDVEVKIYIHKVKNNLAIVKYLNSSFQNSVTIMKSWRLPKLPDCCFAICCNITLCSLPSPEVLPLADNYYLPVMLWARHIFFLHSTPVLTIKYNSSIDMDRPTIMPSMYTNSCIVPRHKITKLIPLKAGNGKWSHEGLIQFLSSLSLIETHGRFSFETHVYEA